MKDGKALQSGTSHYFGDKFSRAYDVTFTGRDNTLQYPFQTSWGASTRLIGAIIMTHGDDDGLILPPAIAPIQVVIVPVAAHKPGVLDKCRELAAEIGQYARVKLDDSDKQPGWKFAQWEMKGVPVRLEVGPRDIENGQCVLVRRDTREKPPWRPWQRTCMIAPCRTARIAPTAPPRWTRSSSLPRSTPALSRRCGAATSPVRKP